jgi:hypothetical protein
VLHRKLCCDNPGHADWTNCPIDGPCSEDARAILASDWLTAHTAAAEARGAERGARAVVKAVEAYYQNDAGSHAGYGRAARGAAAVTTSSAKSSDLATRVPQDESQHRVEGGA